MDIDVETSGFETARERFRDLEADYDDQVVYVVGTGVEYAVYVEFGRGPVEAQDAEALRFEVDGRTVFRQSVGPAEPQPFLRPALRAAERNVDRLAAASDSLAELVERIAFLVERKAKEEAPVDTGTLRASIEARRIQ